MGIFRRVFGSGVGVAHARDAELRGDLAHAAVLFARAGRRDEAARVMVLRGDTESDPPSRLRHYVQAVTIAPEGTEVWADARRKRATAILAITADAPLTSTLRQDLAEAACELEAIGDHARAAEAFRRCGDFDGQVRALARAGDLERLDALLAEAHRQDRDAITRRREHDEMAALLASGRRREAVSLAHGSADEALRAQGRALERRRVGSSVVQATLLGGQMSIALGQEIVLGRHPPGPPPASLTSPDLAREHGERRQQGSIALPSAAISRRHLLIARRQGAVFIRDLGSRNGTTLRGLALSGDVDVMDGVEVRLGGEVQIVVRPTTELPGAVAIEATGMRWIAPLGKAMLGVGCWAIEQGADTWVELVTHGGPPAFSGEMLLSERVTLVVGDVFAIERNGRPVFEVRG